MLCGPLAHIKFGLPLSKSWLKAWSLYTLHCKAERMVGAMLQPFAFLSGDWGECLCGLGAEFFDKNESLSVNLELNDQDSD